MLNERFTRSVPDALPPEEKLQFPEDSPYTYEDIEKLHTQLRMRVSTNQRRRQQILEEYGVGLTSESELESRFELIVDMLLGPLSPDRLRLELRWQDIIAESLEGMAATVQDMIRQQQNSKTLHLPGGGQHMVLPEKEQDNGHASDDS